MRDSMRVRERLKAILGFGGSGGQYDSLEDLRELLAEREATLRLTATYGRPRPDMTDEPTVVFPYTLHTSTGERYGTGAKEFPLPDDGLSETDSNLARFVAYQNGIDRSSVTFDDLAAIEGTKSDAEIDSSGDIMVFTEARE